MSTIFNGSKKRQNVQQLVMDSMLIAMYYGLSLVAIPAGSMKFTLEGLPIIIGALLYGPLDGFCIGFLGSMLGQLLGPYGLTVTTILWIIPHAVRGLLVGLYAKVRRFHFTQANLIFITVLSALVTTTLNTAAMYIDAKVMGYYSKAYVFGSLILRYISGVIVAFLFSVILPPLLAGVNRYLRRNYFDTPSGSKALEEEK